MVKQIGVQFVIRRVVYAQTGYLINAYLFDHLAPLRAEGVYTLDTSEENLERLGLLEPALGYRRKAPPGKIQRP